MKKHACAITFSLFLFSLFNFSNTLNCSQSHHAQKRRRELNLNEKPNKKIKLSPPHTNGKLEPYQYEPWKRKPEYNHDIRYKIRREALGERFGRCYLYAIAKDLGIFGRAEQELPVSCAYDLILCCNVMQYYQQVENPSIGNLVVYLNKNKHITHFGIVVDSKINKKKQRCIVESKWGLREKIYRHDLFNKKGNCSAAFYTKKPGLNNQTIIDSLQQSISQSTKIQQNLLAAKNILLLLSDANYKNIPTKNNFDIYPYSSPYENAESVLKDAIGLSVDCSDLNGSTPLMFATNRNDLDMMKLFLEMGADMHTENKQGHNALMLAQTKESKDLLLQYSPIRFSRELPNNTDGDKIQTGIA